MKNIKICIVILIASFFINELVAQNVKLIAGANNRGSIELKWISEASYAPGEYFIYRKEANQWTKLNTSAIKRLNETEAASLNTEAVNYVRAINEYVKGIQSDQQNGDLALYVRACYDVNMAKVMGIYFEDKTIQAAKSYDYKLTQLISGVEKEIAFASNINSTFTKLAAPLAFSAKQNKAKVEFNWTPNSDKYVVYNIYKRSSNATSAIKLNKIPIFVFNQSASWLAEDTAIQANQTYYYSICGIDALGMESEKSNELKLDISDWRAPKALTIATPKVESNAIILSWKNTNTNLKGFAIWRATEFEGEKTKLTNELLPASTIEYKDMNVAGNTTYFYFIEAITQNGVSFMNQPVMATFRDANPPQQPQNISLKPGIGMMQINWNANTDKDLIGYYIYRAFKDEERSYILLNPRPIAKNNYTDSLDKKIKSTIYYKIVAVDSSYNSSTSSNIAKGNLIDVTAPFPPVLISVVNTTTGNIIKWNKNFEKDANTIMVYRTSENEKEKLIATCSAKQDSIIDKDILAGMSYKYVVKITDLDNNSSAPSNPINIFVATSNKETNNINIQGQYISESKSIQLNWNTSNTSNFTGYFILRKSSSSTEFIQISRLIKETTFSDKQLFDGNQYEYKLIALSVNGSTIESNIISINKP